MNTVNTNANPEIVMQTKSLSNGAMPSIQGNWGATVSWTFFEGSAPQTELVTAVFGLSIVEKGVALVTTIRGYLEMLGGHLEIGESVEQTLIRESYEEGGVVVAENLQFGYREVLNTTEIINKSTGEPYPRLGFVPFFVNVGSLDPQAPLPEDVLARTIIPFDKLSAINSDTMPDWEILILGLKYALQLRTLDDTQREAIRSILG
jgi:8-oxo-dGTP pyrophosphatase MutT (NUDIX family)